MPPRVHTDAVCEFCTAAFALRKDCRLSQSDRGLFSVFSLFVGLPDWLRLHCEEVFSDVVELVEIQLWHASLWVECLPFNSPEFDCDRGCCRVADDSLQCSDAVDFDPASVEYETVTYRRSPFVDFSCGGALCTCQ